MRHTLLFLSLFLAACGGGDDAGNAEQTAPAQSAAATTPAAEQPAPAAEAPEDEPPPAGTATVTFRGPDVNVSGEYPATRCGGPYFIPDQRGVTYETRFEGHTLLMADDQRRQPGAQTLDGGSFHVVINGPNRSFGPAEGQAFTATIGPDFKTAEARGTMSPLLSSEAYQLEVRFTCS
jgi:hypothetical protein